MKQAKALRQSGLRGDVGERTYCTLRDGILEGAIAPGRRLVELAICEWLQVSRTPVRDALRRLQTNGLVELAPGGGLQVVSYDVNALNELYVVREVLEGTAAREAAAHATPAELRMLQESLRLQRESTSDIDAFAQENKAFHGHLYRAAHNRFLLRTLQALHDSVAVLGPTAVNTPKWVKRAISQHSEILQAIEQRDAARAEELTREHIRGGFENRVRALREAAGASKEAAASRKGTAGVEGGAPAGQAPGLDALKIS
jgi:DNA-binding GntR family transcriptional regulator